MALAFGAGCTQTHVVLEPTVDAGPPADGAGDVAAAPATAVSIANSHVCAIAGGALYCWGANAEGRLGVGDTNARTSPVRVGTDGTWQSVAVGERSSLALKQDGTLWSFGANEVGQLGLGDFAARQVPTRVGDRGDWTAIATRFNHACGLAHDGTLWCWGANSEGQLGQDDSPGSATNRPVPTQVTTDRDFAFVDAGDGHTCAVRTGGTLWCWGRNSEAELGQGSSDPLQIRRPTQVGVATDWQAVQSGQNFTCGLRAGGVLCWGAANTAIPGAAPGSIVGSPLAIAGLSGIVALSINTFGGCVIDGAGGGDCWGRNAEGQLGLGDMDDRLTPTALPLSSWTRISAGRFATCGVRLGAVWCTGDNSAGQLGQGDLVRRTTLTEVVLP